MAHGADDHLPDSDAPLTFLTPRHAENHESIGFSARAIVFVKYDESIDCELDRINNLEAINDFLNESWLADHSRSAEQFLDWYLKVPCFSLHYSNNRKAVEALLKLFEDDF